MQQCSAGRAFGGASLWPVRVACNNAKHIEQCATLSVCCLVRLRAPPLSTTCSGRCIQLQFTEAELCLILRVSTPVSSSVVLGRLGLVQPLTLLFASLSTSHSHADPLTRQQGGGQAPAFALRPVPSSLTHTRRHGTCSPLLASLLSRATLGPLVTRRRALLFLLPVRSSLDSHRLRLVFVVLLLLHLLLPLDFRRPLCYRRRRRCCNHRSD